MFLQERDLKILRLCYEQQFLTTEIVADFFYKDVNKGKAYERVYELSQAGFIRREKSIALNGKTLIRLTPQGLTLMRGRSPFQVPFQRGIELSTLEHDLIVTRVRCRIEELWDGIWIPERALRDKYKVIPDGVFQFESSGRTVAVEIENSLKGKARFERLLKTWETVSGVDLVLYVTSNPKIYESLKTYLVQSPKNKAFCLISKESLFTPNPLCWSPVGEAPIFKQRSF